MAMQAGRRRECWGLACAALVSADLFQNFDEDVLVNQLIEPNPSLEGFGDLESMFRVV